MGKSDQVWDYEACDGRRVSDGPSCRFVMKFREVVPVPILQELSVLKQRTSMDRCAYEGPSYLSSRVMKKAAEEIAQVWEDGVHDGPS